MLIEKKKLSELKPAPYNPRQSTKKQEEKLQASLKKFGVVEPVIYNKTTGHIVGGHFRVRELKKLGYKEVECVIVELSEADEKELNIRLNANTGGWDFDELANNWNAEDLNEWGLEIPGFDAEPEKKTENPYTKKIEAPIYEITGEKPKFTETYDKEKFEKLIQEIESSSLDKEEKEFLKLCATRHIVFNYHKIAELYAHASPEMQNLMENSALVIIDFEKAIELGYVKLSEEISELYGEDYE